MRAPTNIQVSTPKRSVQRAVPARTGVRAGGGLPQHNERRAVRVRTGVRAGGNLPQHNERRTVRAGTAKTTPIL